VAQVARVASPCAGGTCGQAGSPLHCSPGQEEDPARGSGWRDDGGGATTCTPTALSVSRLVLVSDREKSEQGGAGARD
jgi:hypothetical protein